MIPCMIKLGLSPHNVVSPSTMTCLELSELLGRQDEIA